MKEDRKIKNVVLIMLDTLQFNYLGCYGNKVVKTPNIDRLARQGFLFENAYSEGLPTVPVRRALMTGRFTLPYGGCSLSLLTTPPSPTSCGARTCRRPSSTTPRPCACPSTAIPAVSTS